jgi:thioredoxin-related protein
LPNSFSKEIEEDDMKARGFLLILVPLIVTCWAQAETALAQIEWFDSIDAGGEAATQFLQPVVISFDASWCGPCKRMEQEVFSDRRVCQFGNRYVFIRVDLDRDRFTASRYRVRSVPTLIFTDPFGNEITRQRGFVPAKELAKVLEDLPKDYSRLSPWVETLGPDSEDVDALVAASSVYRKMGLAILSVKLLDRAIGLEDRFNNHETFEIAFAEKGLALMALGKEKKAKKLFGKRLKKCEDCPMTPYLLLGLGMAQYQRGDRNKAGESFQKVVDGYPDTEYARVAHENLVALK